MDFDTLDRQAHANDLAKRVEHLTTELERVSDDLELERQKRVRAEDDAAAYEYLRGIIDERFNPPDDDVAEEAILGRAIELAAEFIETMRCLCGHYAALGNDDPCPRCLALGRRADQRMER